MRAWGPGCRDAVPSSGLTRESSPGPWQSPDTVTLVCMGPGCGRARARAVMRGGQSLRAVDTVLGGVGMGSRHACSCLWMCSLQADGVTPIMLASEGGHLGVLEVLLQRGADVNHCSVRVPRPRSALCAPCTAPLPPSITPSDPSRHFGARGIFQPAFAVSCCHLPFFFCPHYPAPFTLLCVYAFSTLGPQRCC